MAAVARQLVTLLNGLGAPQAGTPDVIDVMVRQCELLQTVAADLEAGRLSGDEARGRVEGIRLGSELLLGDDGDWSPSETRL